MQEWGILYEGNGDWRTACTKLLEGGRKRMPEGMGGRPVGEKVPEDAQAR